MGALFSSQDEENNRIQAEIERRRRMQNEIERRIRMQDELERRRLQQAVQEQQLRELYRNFEHLTIKAGTTNRLRREEQLCRDQPRNFEKYKVKINVNLIEGLKTYICQSLPNHDLSYNTVNRVELEEDSAEYSVVHRLFKKSNKNYIQAIKIERVDNVYLMAAYLLKKEQFRKRHLRVEEKLMFHGTKSQNIHGICEDNFNWRLRGTGTGHRFGKGVSFSPVAFYATHYSDKRSLVKMMLVANVMYNNKCIGDKEMILPVYGCDTSTNEKEDVYVKYEDNEFYPAYVIHYTGSYKRIQQ